ncbi:uncharacterized protein [Asterias amurensis]|uniref:uncharacterized protein n=1 Tax=Asterias amurensis TaxID=7602 RepID=UPI003AB80E0E
MRPTPLLITLTLLCCAVQTDGRLRYKDETTSCENEDDFECEQGICIDQSLTCNLAYDCESLADETVQLCGCPNPGEFQCQNSCIPLEKRCNGDCDCDGECSDEVLCASFECLEGFVKCDNHLCVSKFDWCNFYDNCGDGSDEAVCDRRQCWTTEFICDNQECINSFYVCDGVEDCLDGSDEKQCSESDFADCGDGTRVHRHNFCDGHADCVNNEADEVGCNCTDVTQFKCNIGKCIPSANVCNKLCDCLDCEDELDCEDCNLEDHIYCPFLDKPPTCLNKKFICNGVLDCEFPADEVGCPGTGAPMDCRVTCSEGDGRCLSVLEEHNMCMSPSDECQPDEFRCKNGDCFNYTFRCDGVGDCYDGSDEENCESFECPEHKRKCAGGICIWETRWCDFTSDCYYYKGRPDLSDENNCTHRACNEDEFRCKNGQCIEAWRRCFADVDDHKYGCLDQSHLKNCRDFECLNGTVKCTRSYCIPETFICDRKIDCMESWSDEALASCFQECSADGCNCSGHIQNCENLNLNSILLDPDHYDFKGKTHFYLAGNHLSFLLENETALAGVRGMVYLDLSDNQISFINSEALKNVPNLHSLILADNNITVLQSNTFFNTFKIKMLKLNGNKITTIEDKAFIGLRDLTTLDLSGQSITSIYNGAFEGLSNLAYLNLSGNNITDIPQSAFFGLNKLLVLDISNNNLDFIHDRAFYGLPNLQQLYTDAYRFCCMAKHVEDCYPKPDEFSSCEDLMANVFLRGSIWVIGIIASVGNLVVIMMRMNSKRDNRVHSFLITNLAIGDFCMGVYLLIIAAVDAYYRGYYILFDEHWRSSGLCHFAGFLSTFSSELSVFSLTIITLHRLFSILFPFRIKDMEFSGAVRVMVITWLMVIFLSAFPLAGLEYFGNFYGRSGVCLALHITPGDYPGWEYSVVIFLVLNFVSFATIAVSYSVMFVVARRTQKAVNRSRDANTGDAMARRMTLIVMTDFVCWIPIILLGVASLGGAYIPPQVYAWIAVFVLPVNSAVNPMLYTLLTAPYVRRVLSRARTSLNLSLATMTTDMKQANSTGERPSRLQTTNGRKGWKKGTKQTQSDANRNAIKLSAVTSQSDTEPDEPTKAEEFTLLRGGVKTTDVDEEIQKKGRVRNEIEADMDGFVRVPVVESETEDAIHLNV